MVAVQYGLLGILEVCMGLGCGSPFLRLRIDLVNSLGSTKVQEKMFIFGKTYGVVPLFLRISLIAFTQLPISKLARWQTFMIREGRRHVMFSLEEI